MHQRCYATIARMVEELKLEPSAVLELGSYNVNGTIRPLFEGAGYYMGIDRRAGPDVDLVVDVEKYDGSLRFDVVVTAGSMEHSAEPEAFLACALRSLKPGGWLLLHAEGDRPHNQDGGHALNGEAYTPITVDWLRDQLASWEDVEVWEDGSDVYARARRAPLAIKVIEGTVEELEADRPGPGVQMGPPDLEPVMEAPAPRTRKRRRAEDGDE